MRNAVVPPAYGSSGFEGVEAALDLVPHGVITSGGDTAGCERADRCPANPHLLDDAVIRDARGETVPEYPGGLFDNIAMQLLAAIDHGEKRQQLFIVEMFLPEKPHQLLVGA